MAILLADTFDTRLGNVRTWVESDHDTAPAANGSPAITSEHSISLRPLDLTNEDLFLPKARYLPEGVHIDSCRAWQWRIKKLTNQDERLTIFCCLINPTPQTTRDATSGELFDCIEIENSVHQMHIGTEDGEALKSRSAKGNEMPKRFESLVGEYHSFTEYLDYGFKTTIPLLLPGEEVYFHYVVATVLSSMSEEQPGFPDASTWFAANKTKDFLDKLAAHVTGSTC